MRGDGRRALSFALAALVCAAGCKHAHALDPQETSARENAPCPADRFAGLVPAARAASPACAGGDLLACDEECRAGAAYACIEDARGKTDADEAAKSTRRACELGALPACTALGALVLDALGEAADGGTLDSGAVTAGLDGACARALFDVACGGRHPEGCARLGRALVLGLGGPKEIVRGRNLLERACDAVGREPCRELAILAQEGAFGVVEPSFIETALRRGCDTGDARACTMLHAKPSP